MGAFGTCDCDTAGGEHLHGSFELFDPVRGRRVELWFVADRPGRGGGRNERDKAVIAHWPLCVGVCTRLHQEIQIRVQMLADASPLEVIFSSQMS